MVLATIQNNEGLGACQNFLNSLQLPVGDTAIGQNHDQQKLFEAGRRKMNPINKYSKKSKNPENNADYNAGAF